MDDDFWEVLRENIFVVMADELAPHFNRHGLKVIGDSFSSSFSSSSSLPPLSYRQKFDRDLERAATLDPEQWPEMICEADDGRKGQKIWDIICRLCIQNGQVVRKERIALQNYAN